MIEIDGVLISEDIVEESFICQLSACKGACCWEGDYGAPVTPAEMKQIRRNLDGIEAFIPSDSVGIIRREDPFVYYAEVEKWGTRLHPDGRCVFMGKSPDGTAFCGIEKAHAAGATDINKPLSCHLYPIRIERNDAVGFEAWNYDRWDICSAACSLGAKQGVSIYQFLKSAIVRYKGEDFYHRLDAAAHHIRSSK